MANEIKLVTYANSEVTPQNDAVLTNLEIASNGVIFGCNVTIKNASTLHINAGMGVVYGREFEIVDSDIPVSLSSSGTLLGQLYVHIDLANTSEPAQLLVDTGNSLTPLVDDPTINITTGSTDYQLATFTVDTSTLANLTETFSIVNNPSALIGNTDISGIGDGTLTGAVSQLNTDLSELLTSFTLGTAETITTFPYTPTANGIISAEIISSGSGWATLDNGFYSTGLFQQTSGWGDKNSTLCFKNVQVTKTSGSISSETYKFFPFVN